MSITDGDKLRMEREIERLSLENGKLALGLIFVERWANHHGAKACHSAESVLNVIQHYPAIHAITKSYKDGVVPDTFDPYAEIEKLKAERDAAMHDVKRYQWIRTCENDSLIIYGDTSHCQLMMEEALDSAIDRAMEAEHE